MVERVRIQMFLTLVKAESEIRGGREYFSQPYPIFNEFSAKTTTLVTECVACCLNLFLLLAMYHIENFLGGICSVGFD